MECNLADRSIYITVTNFGPGRILLPRTRILCAAPGCRAQALCPCTRCAHPRTRPCAHPPHPATCPTGCGLPCKWANASVGPVDGRPSCSVVEGARVCGCGSGNGKKLWHRGRSAHRGRDGTVHARLHRVPSCVCVWMRAHPRVDMGGLCGHVGGVCRCWRRTGGPRRCGDTLVGHADVEMVGCVNVQMHGWVVQTCRWWSGWRVGAGAGATAESKSGSTSSRS